MRHPVGWVLGGGAGLAHFHVGVVWELIYRELFPNCIIAVSAGALVAAKYLENPHDATALEVGAHTKFGRPPFGFNRRMIPHPIDAKSLFENKKLREILEELDMNTICSSDIIFEVVTVDYTNGDICFFDNHSTAPEVFRDAILASTALPGIFKPVPIGTGLFIDGGMRAPLPLSRALYYECESVFAANCFPYQETLSYEEGAAHGWLDVLTRGNHFATVEIIKRELECFEKEHPHIPLVHVRPSHRLLSSPLRWTLGDIIAMTNHGREQMRRALEQ